MSSSFLKNFKNLIQKQYQCEITESIKMKQHLFKFRKEYEIRDPDVIQRFPKKELKSFIKIECPINTSDQNLKEQEVQQSLKRLRALNGVKEDLVCQNCSKKETCKVINFVPEINENSAKTSMSDLLTSMYYFAVEQENKGQVQVETDQDKIEQDIQDSKSGKNKKNQKEKADISIQKYRDCQNESSFYKSCSSANKLTDTMHLLLDDLYNNLGIETKKFVNEYIEEERRRRFMERIYSKIGNDIEQDNKLRKREFFQKYGQSESQNNDQSDDEASEKDLHPLQKKNLKYKKQIQTEDQDSLNENEDDSGNFVQVAGKNQRRDNRSQGKNDLLEKIMNTNQQEGKQFNQMRKQYRNQNNQQEGETENQPYHKQRREGNQNQYQDNQRQNQHKYQDSYKNKENDKKLNYSDRKGKEYHQDKNRYQDKDYQKDLKKRDQSNYKQQFDSKMQQNFQEVNDQLKKGKQEKTSFDKLQQLDDSKLSRFMYKDQKEQKAKIEQESQLKAQLKEQREAKKFEDDFKFVQELVQESDDMLVREADKKRQPKFSKGSFKFSKTIKKE
ncbi:hypothetical protein TTHERM_000920829 (macronuclear) [Tetrahymena thermophila SB210]|uniref:Uncharacterized protein n=1 Tax=Tetrahymena thermophila (strain SB210) TaxID=312017 RepID=W7XDU7_TETTS|nr:hypothetical protein TTHERM_000920829 [Tetrahymena thermophila SB210]EWS70979.1 hypothetical protein TTHERM_000920829 [Tetrahymena thermophila SB210]|eukprot:XP_012656494.1 hypothetical protein TTHERM_000920829 [Tetrahymena thermophila SB210]